MKNVDIKNDFIFHEVCETEIYIVFRTSKFESGVTTSPIYIWKFASSVLFTVDTKMHKKDLWFFHEENSG